MENIIEIKNLSFRYKNKFIYNDFTLDIKRGTWVTIAGANGCGKTTLIKLLAGLEKSYSCIKIFDLTLNKENLYNIRKDIGFCFDNPDDLFACETVEDELAFSLENLGVDPSVIKKKIKEVSTLLKIDNILSDNPFSLSGGEKQKVALACALMLEPRILMFDEALLMIDINERKEIFKIIRDYCTKKMVTVLSFTYNLDEAFYSDRLVVLNHGKIVVDGGFPYVFEEENVMRKIGLEVPFSVELSKKLGLYDITDKVYLDVAGLVNDLWK